MEEELIIDKKPCPGLQVFDNSNYLRYFSTESILVHHSGSMKLSTEGQDVLTALHYKQYEPKMLFFMLSVCYDEEVVKVCQDRWQQDETFTISVYDVILVFLNWGATLERLGIGDDHQLASRYVPTLPPAPLSNFPAPHNVKSILDAISDHISNDVGNNADKERFHLIKVLMTALLDDRYRQYRFKFNQVICKVLETFPDWTFDKVSALVGHLSLSRMGLQNAAYVCCSFFHATSPRVHDFKVMAIRQLLHSRFGLLPPNVPFPSLLVNLPTPEVIIESFRMLEIYFLIQLINTLVVICHNATPCSGALIENLCNWAQAIHFEFTAPKFRYTIEGGFVREKCARLRADCTEIVCTLKTDMRHLNY